MTMEAIAAEGCAGGSGSTSTVVQYTTTFETVYVEPTPASAVPAVAATSAAPAVAPVASVASVAAPSVAPVVASVPSVAAAPSVAAVVASAPAVVSAAVASVAAAVPAVFAENHPTAAASSSAAAVPVASVASSSAAAPASTGSSSSSGGKAGVAYTIASAVTPFVGKSNIGWAYNWNASPGGIASGVTYMPLLWGTQTTYTNTWMSDAKAAISNGATAVLGFNEPDHPQQANLAYGVAATQYKSLITDNFSGAGVTLVSPAVTNGAAPMGLTYLSNFMNACSDCGIDAIAIHWYDLSTNIDYFKSYISGAYTQFGKPIWLTEFGTTDGNDDAFLTAVLPWLESQSYVEKYAYFMAESGKLLTGSELSAAGITYSG